MNNILEVKNLTKHFGEFIAVNAISFELKEGEILGMLGRNGAGKTTTIQMLLGVLTQTSGDISYFGKNMKTHRTEIMQDINFSSFYTELPWYLSVKECLYFLSFLYKIRNRKQRIEKVVEIFQLQPLYNKTIRELSAGQKTRINLAKAFLNFPKVLLLDEPTASLDPETADMVRKFLLEERKQFNVSIILTSHNMGEVEEVCDRIIFIDEGKIIANDTPKNLTRSIAMCHMEFFITKGLEKTIDYCDKNIIKHTLDGNYVRVDIKEKEIATFLKDLGSLNVDYHEVSIDKPNLQDYFLYIARKENA